MVLPEEDLQHWRLTRKPGSVLTCTRSCRGIERSKPRTADPRPRKSFRALGAGPILVWVVVGWIFLGPEQKLLLLPFSPNTRQ